MLDLSGKEEDPMSSKQAYMVIDVALCFDCNNCFMACKDEHVDNNWLPYTTEQPRHGHKWIDIRMKERGQYPRIDVAYLPVICQHCENAACEKTYPNLVKRLENGIVLFNNSAIPDAEAITEVCPFHAIYWNNEKNIPQKCTMCAHILECGQEPGMPRCAHSCPTEAIKFFELEPEKMMEMIEQDELKELCPELNVKPHVFYKNLYRYNDAFISGELLFNGECAEGISVFIKGTTESGEKIEEQTTTDCFGEFKFDSLKPGDYTVRTQKKVLKEVSIKESQNIGVFDLI